MGLEWALIIVIIIIINFLAYFVLIEAQSRKEMTAVEPANEPESEPSSADVDSSQLLMTVEPETVGTDVLPETVGTHVLPANEPVKAASEPNSADVDSSQLLGTTEPESVSNDVDFSHVSIVSEGKCRL